MQQCQTSTQDSAVKRVSVRTGGAGHAHSGVKEPARVNGNIAVAGSDGEATVFRSSSNIVVRLGT
ncbi:hypothetical protein [Dongia deserti]|uniref:hypothetical protein n=1 Tax=Dongia deserti TaxID=2268030 RepID=UPI0013C4C6AF|nr:hypothetical protein [Dongia deserti]